MTPVKENKASNQCNNKAARFDLVREEDIGAKLALNTNLNESFYQCRSK